MPRVAPRPTTCGSRTPGQPHGHPISPPPMCVAASSSLPLPHTALLQAIRRLHIHRAARGTAATHMCDVLVFSLEEVRLMEGPSDVSARRQGGARRALQTSNRGRRVAGTRRALALCKQLVRQRRHAKSARLSVPKDETATGLQNCSSRQAQDALLQSHMQYLLRPANPWAATVRRREVGWWLPKHPLERHVGAPAGPSHRLCLPSIRSWRAPWTSAP